MTDEYLETFARESQEQITELNNALLAFEDDPTDEAAMERIFRTAHTLKGNCGAMGFDPASDLAHAIEDLLESIRAGRVAVTPELMDAVFDGVDELEGMIGEAVQYGEVRSDPGTLIETLREHADAPGLTAPTDDEVASVLEQVDARTDSDHGVYHVRLEVAGELASHGPAIVDALDDAFELLGTDPEGERIDAGNYDGTFDAVFASVVERSAVEAALEPVDAVENHVVTDLTDRLEDGGDDGADAEEASADAVRSSVREEEIEDVSVEELLADEAVDQFDDLEGLAEQVEDTAGLEDLGDAGSFDDLDVDIDDVGVASPTSTADAHEAAGEAAEGGEADGAPADDVATSAAGEASGAAESSDEVQDATSEFQQLKEEVDPVGFDELQEEIEALEFDEYDSDDEVGFDELLGEEELADDDAFTGDEPADSVQTEASQGAVDSAVDAGDDSESSEESVGGAAVSAEETTAGDAAVSADETTADVDDEAQVPGEAETAVDGTDSVDDAVADDSVDADAESVVADAATDDATGDASSVDADVDDVSDVDADADAAEAEADVDDVTATGVDADEVDRETAAATDDGGASPDDGAAPSDDADEAASPADGFDEANVNVDAGSVPAAEAAEDEATVPVEEAADLSDGSFDDVAADATDADVDRDVEHVEGFGEEGSVLDLDGDATPSSDDETALDGAESGDDERFEFADDGETAETATEPGDERSSPGAEEQPNEQAEEAPSAPDAGDAGDTGDTVSAGDADDTGDTVSVGDADDTGDAGDVEDDDPASDDGATPSVDEVLESVDSAGADASAASDLAASDVGDLDLDSSDLASAATGFTGTDGATGERARSEPSDRYGEPVVEAVDEERAARIRSLGVAGGDASEDASGTSSQSIRVQVGQLDRMLNLVEELVTNRARLRRALEEDEPRQVLDDEIEDLEDVTSELQETVMDVRLVPLRTAVNKLPRIVRDVAREQDKEVDFELVGEDVEVDRSIVDEIGDPLVHLVRNAVDHGIEPPEERSAADKPETGSVELHARRERDRVFVTVEDDGSGIDADEVRDAAVEEGVRTREDVEAMDDEAVYDLLFESGLSTAEEVTDVSGRGVGMDVVGETVAGLDGTVSVDSEPGEGTTVQLELPVTLAIAEILFVEVGGEEYGVPIKAVDEVGPVVGLETQDGQEVLVSDGGENERELLRLNEELNTDAHTESGSGMLVHLRDDVRAATLLCDAVRGQQEVVVKPFEGVLEGVTGLSGATVLGDGDVVPILDVETL